MPRMTISNRFTKSWSFNGTSSSGTNAGIDYSANNKLVVSFFCYLTTRTPLTLQVIFELSTNANSVNDGFGIYRDTTNGDIYAAYHDAGGYSLWGVTSNSLPQRRWVHVSVVMDKTLSAATGVKMYIDGVLTGANSLSTATTGGFFGNRAVYVGSRAGASSWFPGNLKDMMIHSFTGTFSADDAKTLYQLGTPTNCTLLDEWLGEDVSTTAVDTGSKLKDLTLSNVTYEPGSSPSGSRSAIVPRADSIFFDRTSDSISMGNNFDKERTDSFSLSGWVKWDGYIAGAAHMAIIGKFGSTGPFRGYHLSLENSTGKLQFQLTNTDASNAIQVKSTVPIQANTWVFVEATYDGTSLAAGVTLYINGSAIAKTVVQDTLSATTSNSNNFSIGCNNAANQGVFSGNIFDARLHSTKHTQAQVIELMRNSVSPSDQGRWGFTDFSGATLTATVGGVNGTISGAVWTTERPPFVSAA